MSVIVIGRISVDASGIEPLWAERKGDFEAVAAKAKAAGCIHHRWGFGDGFVVIIDEWPDGESFQAFFDGEATIGELMQAANVQGPPEFTIVEAKTGPDSF